MIVPAPVDPRSTPIAQAWSLPKNDAEARADRRILRRMDILAAVKQP